MAERTERRVARERGVLPGALLLALCFVPHAVASEIEVVATRFGVLPRDVPVSIFNSGMTEDDDAIAKRIAEGLAREGYRVLDREPGGDETVLDLAFELDRFVPRRPDDRSGFGIEVRGSSSSGVGARILVPKLKKELGFQDDPEEPPPGPVLTLDMRVNLGSSRRIWIGRATAPLGRRSPLDLEAEMADRLVNALTAPPAETGPPE